jgi:hypothetical protein
MQRTPVGCACLNQYVLATSASAAHYATRAAKTCPDCLTGHEGSGGLGQPATHTHAMSEADACTMRS